MSEPRDIQMLYFFLSFSSVLAHIFPNHVDSRENIVTRRVLIYFLLGRNSEACTNKKGLRAPRDRGTTHPPPPAPSLEGAPFSIIAA